MGIELSRDKAVKAYVRFIALARELGLQLVVEKCAPPATSVTWLGFIADTVEMLITLPADQLNNVLLDCRS